MQTASMRGIVKFAAFAIIMSAAMFTRGDEAPRRPKYGPAAVRLFHARDFIRRNAAPDFWALMPYYLPQQTDASCSVASVAMLMNALRANHDLGANEPLATPAALLERVEANQWRNRVAAGGVGVTLDEFAEILQQAAEAYGVREARVEVFRFSDSPEDEVHLRRILKANERSDRDFLIVNFLQSVATGDPEGAVGHLAPLGAYDSENDRVLLFDPDRQWYEPYWITVDTLLEAMNTTDSSSGRSRGLVRITRSER